MDENQKYITIKKLVETAGNKKIASIYLNCSERHINRMIKGYKQVGKAYFIHGNRGRMPVHALENSTKQLILDLYRTKYSDANITHFYVLLKTSFESYFIKSLSINTSILSGWK